MSNRTWSEASPLATTQTDQDHPSVSHPHSAPIVILNPHAAFGRSRKLLPMLQQALRGGRGDIHLTDAPADGRRLACEAAQSGRAIIVVGGDGSIAEVAEGIIASGSRAALGVVPAGTGNDYAYGALKLPHDPIHALDIALNAAPQAFDAGEVNGRIFVNYFGVGLDANIAHTADGFKRLPFLRGQRLYWAASLSELLLRYDRCPRLHVSYNATADAERAYALATVSLGPTYGGGFRINPTADPTDGLLDLCAVWKPSLLRALRLLPMIEQGKHLGQPEARFARIQRVRIIADAAINAHRDGEIFQAATFEAHVLPGALSVRCSARR